MKVDFLAKQEIYFLHSCIPTLRKLISAIIDPDLTKIPLSMFQESEKVLSEVIFFITDTEDLNPFTAIGIPRRRA
jgi:hypothetical protein